MNIVRYDYKTTLVSDYTVEIKISEEFWLHWKSQFAYNIC